MNPALPLARFAVGRPQLTLVLSLVATVAFSAGVARIDRETTARTFLGPDHPVIAELDDHIATFGGGYPVIVAYSCDETPLCDSVFDDAALKMARDLASRMAQQFGVIESQSVATTSLVLPSEEGLSLRRFADERGSRASDASVLAERASQDPLWVRQILGEDGRAAAVVLEISSTESEVQKTVAAALEEALAPHREAGWRFHLVGELVDFTYAGLFVERETQRMAFPLVLALAGALLFFLRSVSLTVLTIGAMGMAYGITNGAMGWAGLSINALTAATPSVVMAVAILDAVHLIARLARRMAEEPATEVSSNVLSVCAQIGTACWLTSLTTIAAFGSFAFSGVRSFAEFGLSAAFGVAVAFVLTFTALPSLLLLMPREWLNSARTPETLLQLKGVCSAIVKESGRRVVLIGTIGSLVAAVGIVRLRIDISPEHLAGTENPVSTWSRWVAVHLRGTESLEVGIVVPEAQAHADPAVLGKLRALGDWMDSELPGIHHTRSVYDTLAWIRRALHSDEASYQQPSDNRQENAEAAFLLTLQDPRQLERWVSGSETTSLRLSAEADLGISTTRQASLVAALETELEAVLPSTWEWTVTGSVPLYAAMMRELQSVQIRCFGIACATIFLFLWFHSGTLWFSVAAMVPTVLPVLATLGFMGWASVPLDPGTTMVAAIGVGVGVDDSIHLLSAYLLRYRDGDALSAATGALDDVAPPVIASSIMLCAGFFALSFSALTPIASFGLLACLTVLAALAADLLLLPAILSMPRASRAPRRDEP